MASDIFISYRSLDEQIVKKVMTSLELSGVSCWYAPKDIKAGGKHDEVIMPQIESTKIFMFFLSENNWPRKGYEKAISKWVRAELLTAIDYDHVYFLPVKLDKSVDEPTINLAYKSLPNYFDLTLHTLDEGISALISLVKDLLTNESYKKDNQDNFREAYKKIDLELLKQIEKNIRGALFDEAQELIDSNPSLKKNYKEKIQFIESILKLSKRHVKEMTFDEITSIVAVLKSLRKSEYKNISYYLEALIAQSFFDFNGRRNDLTDSYLTLKELSKKEGLLKPEYLRLTRHIKSTDEKFQVNWLRN